jgi:hypothetical protein
VVEHFFESYASVLLVFVALPLVVVAYGVSQFRRSSRMVAAWASSKGYQVTSKHLCLLWGGPFWASRAAGTPVYRISVSDSDGHIRSGWVRCAVLGDQVEEAWEREA